MGVVVNYPPPTSVVVHEMENNVAVTYPPPTSVVINSETNEVLISAAGPRGAKGDPGIIVSAIPPENPAVNDLWIDIS